PARTSSLGQPAVSIKRSLPSSATHQTREPALTQSFIGAVQGGRISSKRRSSPPLFSRTSSPWAVASHSASGVSAFPRTAAPRSFAGARASSRPWNTSSDIVSARTAGQPAFAPPEGALLTGEPPQPTTTLISGYTALRASPVAGSYSHLFPSGGSSN